MHREKNNLYEYPHSNSINPYIIELLQYKINHRLYHTAIILSILGIIKI